MAVVMFIGEMIEPSSGRPVLSSGTYRMLQRASDDSPLFDPLVFGLVRLARSNALAVMLQPVCAGWWGLRLHRDLRQRNFNSRRKAA